MSETSYTGRYAAFRSGKPLLSRAAGNFDKAPSRAKLYAFVLSQPIFPTLEDMCDHMGWRNLASVSGALSALFSAGYLHKGWQDGKPFWIIPPGARADFEAWQRERAGSHDQG